VIAFGGAMRRNTTKEVNVKKRTYETAKIATIDTRGQYVTVIEETEQTGFDALGSTSTTWKDGIRSYRTAGGAPVNWVSNNEFQLVSSGEKLKRV
jgi:hypothetical protein